MQSRISEVRDKYGKYLEILPDELNDDHIEKDLKNVEVEMKKIFDEETRFIETLIKKNMDYSKINLREFERSDQLLIRRGFLERNEQLNDTQEINYYIAHLFMCKSTLSYMSKEIFNALNRVREHNTKYSSSKGRDKRTAFIALAIFHQKLIGLTVNICKVIEEYQENFRMICRRLDKDYVDDGSVRSVPDIFHYELLQGVTELLLRGNFGSSTPAPLVRSAIEIMIMRIIFNTEYSMKYKHMQVLMEKSLILNDILSAADTLKIKFQFGTDCIRKLYAWGSISTHYGFRMERHEIWQALWFAQRLGGAGLIICHDDQLEKNIDSILDLLVDRRKIKIRP